jgi:predicted transcriptional regulator
MKVLLLLISFSLFSAALIAEDHIYIGRTLSDKKDCSLTIVDITVEEDGIKTYLVKTSFTGSTKLRKLSNLVMTRKRVAKYVASDIIVDNSFTEDSKDRISILVQNNDAKTLVYETRKKKIICRLF